jgi:hypothetical protein
VHAQIVRLQKCVFKVRNSLDVRWTIAPNRRDNSPAEERNSSRHYQFILKSMKLMPDVGVSKETFQGYFTNVKGKCKATNDPDDAQPSKRFDGDDDDEDQEVEGSRSHLHHGQAMQVTDD